MKSCRYTSEAKAGKAASSRRTPKAALEDGGRDALRGFDGGGGGVPSDGGSAEVGFIRHVASQRGVVAEESQEPG